MSKINVAIVDDNERMVHLLDSVLKTDESIEVVGHATDGAAAVSVIKETQNSIKEISSVLVSASASAQGKSPKGRRPSKIR